MLDGSALAAQQGEQSGCVESQRPVPVALSGALGDAYMTVEHIGDSIQIVATINVDTTHVGMAADIIVAVEDTVTSTLFLIDSNGALVPISPLAEFRVETALSAVETINVLGGAFTLTTAEAGASVNI